MFGHNFDVPNCLNLSFSKKKNEFYSFNIRIMQLNKNLENFNERIIKEIKQKIEGNDGFLKAKLGSIKGDYNYDLSIGKLINNWMLSINGGIIRNPLKNRLKIGLKAKNIHEKKSIKIKTQNDKIIRLAYKQIFFNNCDISLKINLQDLTQLPLKNTVILTKKFENSTIILGWKRKEKANNFLLKYKKSFKNTDFTLNWTYKSLSHKISTEYINYITPNLSLKTYIDSNYFTSSGLSIRLSDQLTIIYNSFVNIKEFITGKDLYKTGLSIETNF